MVLVDGLRGLASSGGEGDSWAKARQAGEGRR